MPDRPALPAALRRHPVAHRGLYDPARGVIENSRAAIARAAAAGYGVEIDIQLSADGEAMVFHDDDLERLTPEAGPLRLRSAAELSRIPLRGSAETIPTLAEILGLAGNAPLLVEIKDQDGALGPRVGALESRAARLLAAHDGPVAVMSFNPHAIAACRDAAPAIPRGLVTCPFTAEEWPGVAADRRAHLARIADFDTVGAAFISHFHRALDMAPVRALRARGTPVLCWTVRSAAEEAAARARGATNVTFEGYLPDPG